MKLFVLAQLSGTHKSAIIQNTFSLKSAAADYFKNTRGDKMPASRQAASSFAYCGRLATCSLATSSVGADIPAAALVRSCANSSCTFAHALAFRFVVYGASFSP
jgi:hypothetical protein